MDGTAGNESAGVVLALEAESGVAWLAAEREIKEPADLADGSRSKSTSMASEPGSDVAVSIGMEVLLREEVGMMAWRMFATSTGGLTTDVWCGPLNRMRRNEVHWLIVASSTK